MIDDPPLSEYKGATRHLDVYYACIPSVFRFPHVVQNVSSERQGKCVYSICIVVYCGPLCDILRIYIRIHIII